MIEKIRQFFGIERATSSHTEKLIASLGGVLGISVTYLISFYATGHQGAAIIVPSMGASAVLLFAVPHGALSQPWALFGGHLVSAIVGVSCYLLVPDTFLAAGLAVGLAIGAMHVLNCIHPPGGATALAAVIGGPAIHELGFLYVLNPIYINVLVIFCIAVLFNSIFRWRRYPVSLMNFEKKDRLKEPSLRSPVKCRHIEQAITEMNLVLDVTAKELEQVFLLALMNSENDHLNPDDLVLGQYYTNGKFGKAWSVRQIIDESADSAQDLIIYRCAEGAHAGKSNSCSRQDFAKWAARQVNKNEQQ